MDAFFTAEEMQQQQQQQQQRKRVAITSSFFPVNESLLPRLNITPEQHEELRDYAIQAALDAVRDGPTWGRSNIEHAVSNGWKVLSARPTACFMTKKQTKKKKRKGTKTTASHAEKQKVGQQQRDDDDKRVAPPTSRVTIPGVTNLDNVDAADICRDPIPTQPFAPLPLETTRGQQFMAHAVIPNSLEDVMNTLYCEHTREMRDLQRKVYGDAALDCCILQTLEGATLEDPFWYLGLKWLALRSPMQALMASREFVYLEHLGTHVDSKTGRTMLYRVAQSVHIGEYGGQESYFGLTRGHIETAFVYWMDDGNDERNPLLHVCAKGRIHMKGNMPDILVYRYLKAFWRLERVLFPVDRSSLGNTITNDSIDQPLTKASKKKKTKKKSKRRKVISYPPLEMAQEWVADELRPRCSVCNKKFRLVKRLKHHCRACGEIMCRECTFHHRVNVRAAQSFRGLRGTVTASADVITTSKSAGHQDGLTDFGETMTCSFDIEVEREGKGGEFDASISMANARKAVHGPMETAVLGGDAVVGVMLAKVCLRCLQSAPLANRSKRRSTQKRRHSDIAVNGRRSTSIPEANEELNMNKDIALRAQTWTPNYVEVEELDGLDDDDTQMPGGELDLPMLGVDDTDAESVDDLAEIKRRSTSNMFALGSSIYRQSSLHAQDWDEQEDGGLDSHRNHERVMILSPHALSTSSSLSSLQMYGLAGKADGSDDSSNLSERYPSQHRLDVDSDIDGDDSDSIQFYPMQSSNRELDDEKLKAVTFTNEGFDPNSLYDLKDEDIELAVSAAVASVPVMLPNKALRGMHNIQDEMLYQNRQIPSPSALTTSLCSENDDDECSEIDEPMRDLRHALAQVEESLADQARILFTIEQERKQKAATSTVLFSSSFVKTGVR